MIYDGVITKPPLETLMHFNPNHDPKNGKFTTGSGGIGGSNQNLSKMKIKTDSDGYMTGTIKDKNSKSEIFIMGNSKDGLTKNDIKKSASIFMKNKDQIKKVAIQAIKEDSSLMRMMKENSGLSEKEILNNLEIGSIWLSGNNKWPSEISIYDKFSKNGIDLLYGHSLDMEIDLSNPKKPKWVAMNG